MPALGPGLISPEFKLVGLGVAVLVKNIYPPFEYVSILGKPTAIT